MLLAQSRDPFNNIYIPEDSSFILESYKDLVDDAKVRIDYVDTYRVANEKKIGLMAITSDSTQPVTVTGQKIL